MNSTAFHDALTAGKLLLILSASPFVAGRKESMKAVSRIRANVDQALLALKTRTDVHAVHDGAFEAYLSGVRRNLVQLTEKLHPDALICRSYTRTTLFRPGASNITSLAPATTFVRDVLVGIAAQTPKATNAALASTLASTSTSGPGTQVLKDFASLVRNADWLYVLNALGLDPTAKKTQEYVERLSEQWGSRTGKAQVRARSATFADSLGATVPRRPRGAKAASAKAAAVQLEALTVVQVSLDVKALTNFPRTWELNADFHEVAPRIPDLLQAAAQPVRLKLGEDVTAAAQAKLTDFLAGLETRAKKVEEARAKMAAAAVEAQKNKAVEALRKLGPLAQVLKDHPELLKKV